MLEKVKLAMRLTIDAFDAELLSLIEAAELDLGIAGVIVPANGDPLVERAIITYCRMNFGSPDDYERLRESYETQRKQLMIASGYTDWGESR